LQLRQLMLDLYDDPQKNDSLRSLTPFMASRQNVRGQE
jgi:hypothetical protein